MKLLAPSILLIMSLLAAGSAQACERQRFDGATFTVCRFDPAKQRLTLMTWNRDGQPLRSLANLKSVLGADARKVDFAMNAGMFDAAGGPVGLYVEAGKERHPVNRADGFGNFHLKPNGVFWLDKTGAHVAPTDAYLAKPRKPRLATQSGPMLLIAGKLHLQIADDGPSRLFRNGVGDCGKGRAAFVITENAVSFGKFARLFRDKLKCPSALYLDGNLSSLWDPAHGRLDNVASLGPMVVVARR